MTHLAMTTARRTTAHSLMLFTAFGCAGGTPEAAANSERPPEVVAATVVVERSAFGSSTPATGVVTAAPGSAAALSAAATARVARVFVAVGDPVRVGDPLVSFDHTTFDADVSRAGAALLAAQQTHDRLHRLTEIGVAPRKELDAAVASMADAQAALTTAQRAQRLSTLRAPINGVVSRVSAVRDESVDPTRTVVEVVDPSRIEVVFGLTPRDAGEVRNGSDVALLSSAFGGSDTLGVARVIAVGSTVDTLTRNVIVRTRVLHSARPLRIGESVIGRIAGATSSTGISIPVAALVPTGETFHVFVVDTAGIAHVRPVRVLAQSATTAQIASGLAVGERVVTTGAFGVDDGVKIVAKAR